VPRGTDASTPTPPPAPSLAARARALGRTVADALRGDTGGAHAAELRDAQRDVILSRTAVLIWISVFVMPTACWGYVWFSAPARIGLAVRIVLAAIAAVLVILALVKRGVFDRRYHLSMLVLVGGVFAPTGAAIMEITQAYGGDFFFAFFLIFFAFTALYPADVKWILATAAAIIAFFTGARAFRPAGLVFDTRLVNSLIYLLELTFIGVVLNRVMCRLFFDERRSRIELRAARDALFAEMEVAQEIQTLLLPKRPVLAGHAVSGRMVPASEVGGDYYDVIEAANGRTFLAIGDVSGHGVTSGLTMMMARASLLGTLAGDPAAPLPVLYCALNRCLRANLARMDLRLYMTFALFEHLGAGRYRAVGAHLPALVWRRARGAVEELELSGTWLGVLDELAPAQVPEATVELAWGDLMLLYTDGIVERLRGREMFGFERLKAALAEAAPRGPDAVIDALLAVLQRYDAQQDDDITLLAIHHTGEQAMARAS
jgi:hypothetical protein